jgi:hypothetical protein
MVQSFVSLGALVVSIVTTISTVQLGWRTDRGAATELQIKLTQLQLEIEKLRSAPSGQP